MRPTTAQVVQLGELVGRVGCHEAITVAGAVFDMHPDESFTLTQLAKRIRDLTNRDGWAGDSVWTPSSQVLRHYCRHCLVPAGVVEPEAVVGRGGMPTAAYRSRPQPAEQWRTRLYESLARWGLDHPDVSVQQVLGPSRGHGLAPARVRVPLYRILLGAYPHFIPYEDLIDALVSDHLPLNTFRTNISGLTTHKILIRQPHPRNPHMATVAIANRWVETIRDLIKGLDRAREAVGDEPSLFTDAGHVRTLLNKAARFSSLVVAAREMSAIAQQIHELVAQATEPVSAVQLSQQLRAAGRPISRGRVLAYLKELVSAGKLEAVGRVCRVEGTNYMSRFANGYTVAPESVHQAEVT